MFRCGSHEVEGLPGTPKDVVVNKADATVTDMHGTGRESIDIFPVKQVLLEFLFRDEVRRCAIELSQQAALADRGLLRTFALTAELQAAIICWRSGVMTGLPCCVDELSMCVRKDIVQGMARQEGS